MPLCCPHCGQRLVLGDRSWSCPAAHSFDVARQGYVNLLVGPPGRRPSGDDAEMLDARRAVHDTGLFEAVLEAVGAAVDANGPDVVRVVLEVGAGNGHWLDHLRVARGVPVAVAVDASTAAARRAGRREGVTAVVADAWGDWPLLDASVDVLLSVFAPRNVDESARVLAPEGVAVVVVPGSDHLVEVAERLGMLAVPDDRASEVVAAARPRFDLRDRVRVVDRRRLSREALVDLALMGPAGHHHDRVDLATAATELPDPTEVTVDCHVLVLAPR